MLCHLEMAFPANHGVFSCQKCCRTFRQTIGRLRLDIVMELLSSQLENLVSRRKSKFKVCKPTVLAIWYSRRGGSLCHAKGALNLHQLSRQFLFSRLKWTDTHDQNGFGLMTDQNAHSSVRGNQNCQNQL